MIPKECKRLAEVDFPVAEVSKHSAREKSIRHGHPSTLHLWWARRPLAACRAMLMALLLPDPCDENCPPDFKREARRLLALMPGGSATRADLELRKALLKFIADFANWDNSAKPVYLECARGLVKAAHGEEPPLVVDPFAGGGSIPLEALRVGCDAFASDLNPVACLILKVLLEDIPRHGPELAKELRRVGKQIKEEAEKELAGFYPVDPDGARPIAYLWARTVRCEAVGCGAEIPLMRSFWLCKKSNRRRALRLVLAPSPGPSRHPLPQGRGAGGEGLLNTVVSEKRAWRFEIFGPNSESEVRGGTVTRGNATCPCCNTVLPVARVRAQLSAQRGGADVIFEDNKGGTGILPVRTGGARLLAVVTLDENKSGRQYRLPAERDYEAVWKAQERLKEILAEWERLPADERGLCPVPDEPLPSRNTLGLRVPNYGVKSWADLFSARQELSLTYLARQVQALRGNADGPGRLKEALALSVSRTADYCSANCSLHAGRDVVRNTWARNALPVVWDFYESIPCGESSGSFEGAVGWVAGVVEQVSLGCDGPGQVELADASQSPLPDDGAQTWFTDPPYYDAIGYAESADFFFVWLKRMIPNHVLLRDPFDNQNVLTPKARECIQDDTYEAAGGRTKDRGYFEACIAKAFEEGRRLVRADGAACVVFAHKTTEGWEALLGGMRHAGWVVTASWPIETEMQNKVSGSQSGEKKAMLLASIHLVCRPRPYDAGIGGWEEILRELPNRIGDWMERLSGEGIRGADLVFSCIGPALELFSRYVKVETAEGREVKLDEFLEKVWEAAGRTALQQVLGTAEARARNGAAGALEEDARLTALFLWTLQSTDKGLTTEDTESTEEETNSDDEDEEESKGKAKKGFTLIYDVARRFAQPLGIHMENWEGRIIETKKGVVRLLPVTERAGQLFGEAGTESVARAIERSHGQDAQFTLFPDQGRVLDPPLKMRKSGKGRRKGDDSEASVAPREATTLDRVHAAMLLQAGGQATALRAMLDAETQRSPDFLRLANALSALYPKDSEEKRLLDAMLLAVPR